MGYASATREQLARLIKQTRTNLSTQFLFCRQSLRRYRSSRVTHDADGFDCRYMKCEWLDCLVETKTKDKIKKRESNLLQWEVGHKRNCACKLAVQ